MTTPSSRAFTYDVFLSFRGEDTRYGFTGNLYKALSNKGIHTFIDDEKLRSGEAITTELVKAIEESRIAIIVLSNNYASSSFCLDELVVILDCKSKGLLVIPVFYKVDPSHVRHQKGSYGEALAKHQKRFKAEKEKLEKWKMTLYQVAGFSGYHFQDGIGYEYKFIGRIVEKVSMEINPARLHVADYPVGLGSQVLEVRKLLNAESCDGFKMIAMYGMGGIGKTTLALAVYNLIAACFDGSCFLQNVREKSNKHGLEHLQRILLSKILGEKDINLASEHEGISMIQQRLQRKKVLLILDDVDKCSQLQALVGSPDWFGPGSRVILTTRDTQPLASYEVKITYKVKKLNKNDAFQLLTWKAFKTEQFDPSYVEVLNQVVTYASGLPLALEVIGSNLFAKSVEQWKSAINQYQRIPNNQILEKLKISFKALEEEEKSVFLDIACCFRGYKLAEVEILLRALYDDCMKHYIGVLIEKSLINVSRRGTVEMHDLIQDMGRQIDQKESPKEPGKRRRLWLPKDVIHVLKDNNGTSQIEIIWLDFFISEKKETVECNENTFMEMENLKILIIPDVSYLPNLEELSFEGCESLIAVDDSVGFMSKLKILNAKGCSKLLSFPHLHLTSLERLELSLCSNLKNFPKISRKMGNIRKLSLNELRIEELPVSFQNLTGLEELCINCDFLRLSPIVLTPELFDINIYNCKEWQWVNSEEGFALLARVSILELWGSNVTFLPECIKEFHNLFSLNVSDCKRLKEIRGVPPNLKRFRAINCISLTSSGSSMLLNQVLC
ncbi:unnamed protein product [Sphenostylis stenocarpa]|uniref:TIR domain-containing protein n=1 Tax=Sphenostylis stenocarpa TaxID=92480 RepID=A0AA86SCX0_9FABA|nr:unnamed protein product [Sphenostylis stenocarpa]